MANFQAETVGNATLIIKNKMRTILVTDPWFDEYSCYFGSWRLTHEIPKHIKEKALKTKYVFISHFHPDHLNLQTLRLFKKNAKIILSKQYSNRVFSQLTKAGFDVIEIQNRKWIELDDGLKILTFSDSKLDSTLLVELKHGNKQSLIINLNDSNGCGCSHEIKEISQKYRNSILLQLASYGDADMINLWDYSTLKKLKSPCDDFKPIGQIYEKSMNAYDCNISIPFSSSHQYQREDSWWARKYGCIPEDHFNGFLGKENKVLLPIFQKMIFQNDSDKIDFENINPKKVEIITPVSPSAFGDDWLEGMKKNDKNFIHDYFYSIEYLRRNYDSISVKFNTDEYVCNLNKKGKYKKNILFHAPRRSFMYAIKNKVFDDLLIGNFMRTYLQGATNLRSPKFTFYVAKLSDNAYVNTKHDIDMAFAYYNQDRGLIDKYSTVIDNLISTIKDQMLPPSLRSKLRRLFFKF